MRYAVWYMDTGWWVVVDASAPWIGPYLTRPPYETREAAQLEADRRNGRT